MKRKKLNKSDQQRTQKGQNLANMTEDQARAHIEGLIWPDGEPVCRHCGSVDCYRMQGEKCRPGLCRCRDCKRQFTVTVGTIFEKSKIPLAIWIRAFHLMCSSKKGISALQLQRNLGLGSYRTAWHLAHRIRLAMKCEPMAGLMKGIVESDEAFIGGKPRPVHMRGGIRGRKSKKQPVQTLVERDGRKRTVVMPEVTAENLRKNLEAHVDKSASIHTDDHSGYRSATKGFADHRSVEHGIYEYARKEGDITVTSNTAESSFSLLKRGVYGTFHSISKKHMQRYCDEFDFRWDHRKATDVDRTNQAIRQAKGKRLMYREPTDG